MSNKFKGNTNGKGYYIALILCAVAIGISGYLYYRNTNNEPQLNNPDVSVAAVEPSGSEDIQAVATQPQASSSAAAQPTQGSESASKQPLKTVSPVEGETVAAYAMDCLSYNETTRDWRVHNGVDIAAELGTNVRAAADGTVYTVYEDETMGMTVVIRHEDGYITKYSSLADEVSVQPGDTVEMGQVIGCVGQTALLESAIGPHVHFSVSCNDEIIDPAEFLSLGE